MSLDRIITVAPSSIRLKTGEVKQVQVITDYENIRVTMSPEGIVEWDEVHREFKGLKRGYVNIKFEAYQIVGEDETILGEDHIAIDVSDESLKSPVRYMWHNRATNRLVTILGDSNEDEDLIFKLPKKSGTLITDIGAELFDTIIATPEITSPTTGTTDYDGIITASDFALRSVMKQYPHTGTTWQYATDVNFKNILKEEYIHKTANNPLTTTSCSYYGISTYVRVRYHSNSSKSYWSEPVLIHWSVNSPDGECNTIIEGTNDTTAYYGIVNESNVIDNRDYRGNYSTLMANNIKTFLIGQQVTHKNKLYYCPTALNTTQSATEPGTNESIWTTDTREKLPTVRWLMDKVGIGLGNTDNNIDTYTTDGTKVGDLLHKTDNTWLKFIHKGKLIYTTAKPICTAISWCDVGKRNAVYGNRTVLIGSHLYRIRLLKEEEYQACFIDIPANNQNLRTTLELVDKNLIEDFREGPNRYVISQTGEKTSVKAGTRTCAYRPVLELIRKGDEPFNKIPECAEADNELFRYDPYTDTGYFGVVTDTNLITTEELMLYMAYTNGTKRNQVVHYVKFYFHGITFFLTQKPLRYGGTALFLENLNLSFPVDMGRGERLVYVKGNTRYLPSACNGIRVFPWSGQTLSNYQEDTQYTMLWRLCKGFVNAGTSGKQVGDNWEEFDPYTFITDKSYEYLFQEIGIAESANQNKSILNGSLLFILAAVLTDISDDEYPLILTVKNYDTITDE